MDDVIVVSKDSFDSKIEFKFTHEDGTTTTRKVNAALSTLLHEVTHFTEGTKEYAELAEFIFKQAEQDVDFVREVKYVFRCNRNAQTTVAKYSKEAKENVEYQSKFAKKSGSERGRVSTFARLTI